MGTEPAVQRIAVSLYQAGARDADLEFEMGAHAMSERNYTEAEQHLARVTDGAHTVQAAVLRTLAFELLGKLDEARPIRARRNPPVTRAPPAPLALKGWLASETYRNVVVIDACPMIACSRGAETFADRPTSDPNVCRPTSYIFPGLI